MNEQLDNFFHAFSKVAILIPIVVVILILVVRLGFRSSAVTPTPPVEKIVSPTLERVSSPSSDLKLNIAGESVCDVSYADKTAKVYIKNKKVSVVLNEKIKKHFILSGDCFYRFDDGSYSGEKTCGLKTLVDMVGLFPLDFGTLIQIVPKNMKISGFDTAALSKLDLNAIKKSCQEMPVGESNFLVPTSILFKNIAK